MNYFIQHQSSFHYAKSLSTAGPALYDGKTICTNIINGKTKTAVEAAFRSCDG